MNTVVPTCLLFGTFLAGSPGAGRPCETRRPAEPRGSVTVETSSGRRFSGDVDARSNADCLWLRSTYGKSWILRPIRWHRVVHVSLGEERYTSEAFRAAVRLVLATIPPQPISPRPATVWRLGPQDEITHGEKSKPRDTLPEQGHRRVPFAAASVPRPAPPARLPPVRAVEIDVRVANWDRDVEVDGLLVEVRPQSAGGATVPAEGTLWVNLVGRPNTPVNRPAPPVRLGRWSRRVAAEDFGLRPAVYRLPFQAANPAFDMDIAPDGLVNARLSVPGQGVFEASRCSVRLRPYCCFRDELFRATGRWYLPRERTGQ